MTEIKNAIIQSADISKSDHGMLSGWLSLSFDSTDTVCQSFGGSALYIPPSHGETDWTYQVHFGGRWLWRVMQIAGVDEWSKLKGCAIRVSGDNGRLDGIGHIVDNDWFFPQIDFDELRSATRKAA